MFEQQEPDESTVSYLYGNIGMKLPCDSAVNRVARRIFCNSKSMNNKINSHTAYKEIIDVWRTYTQQDESAEHLKAELEIHKRLLNYFQIGEFYYYIFNLSTLEFDFMSPGVEKVLGYRSDELSVRFLLNLIHPDDLTHFTNNENHTLKFLWNLPKEKSMKYKVQGDYRFQKNDGTYVRILHQAVVCSQYPDGSPSRALGIHTDISHLKLHGTPVLSYIGLDGEPSFVDVKVGKPLIKFKILLSSRECDVINLLAQGKSYKEIANTLFISTETVRRHLANIYRKLNVKSKIEALNVVFGSHNLSL